MLAVSKAGYRAIAPDFRGYGLSQIPSENFLHVVPSLFFICRAIPSGGSGETSVPNAL